MSADITVDIVAAVLVDEAWKSLTSGRRASLKKAAAGAGFTLRRDDRQEPAAVPATWRDPETGRDYGRCPTCLVLWPLGLSRSAFHQTRPPEKEGRVVKQKVRELCSARQAPDEVERAALEWADRYYVVEHLERIGCEACNQPF